MNYICFNQGEWIALVCIYAAAFVGMAIVISIGAKARYNKEMAEAQLAKNERKAKEDHYIFKNLFTLTDIIRVANSKGYEITQLEAVEIVSQIKKHYTLERGISAPIIAMHVSMYVADKSMRKN
jgi:hypothetical protein